MMKAVLTAILCTILGACGSGGQGIPGKQGETGKQGDVGDIIIILEEPQEPESEDLEFVGEYYLDFKGFIIISLNHENQYSVDARYETENPDGSICILDLDANYIDERNNLLTYSNNVILAKGNCDSDKGSPLKTKIKQSYQYEVELSFGSDGILRALLMVFQIKTGVRTLVIDRILEAG